MSGRSTVSVNNSARYGESGSATTKFLIVGVLLFLVAFAGFNYLTVWYQCAEVQTAVKETIDRANMSAVPADRDIERIKQYIRRKGDENNMPADAIVKVERNDKGTSAQVSFTREISLLPFNLYKYKYDFNQTAGPATGFLTK